MSGGFIGDHSVRWHVNVDFARPDHTRIRSSGATGVEHEGTEETKPKARFVIKIRYPRDPDARKTFLKQLRKAAANKTGKRAVFSIPIEDINSGFDPPAEDQITVDWTPKLKAAPQPPPQSSPAAPRAGKKTKYLNRPFNIMF